MKRLSAVFFITLFLFAGRASAQGPVLLIGLIPEQNLFHQVENNKLLAEYIKERTGIKVQFTILSRYGDIVDRFASRHMDGAFFGAFTGYLATAKLGIKPFMRPLAGRKPLVSKSLIIIRKDSGINNLSQLRGRKAVFVDKASMGFIYMLYKLHLRENGMGSFFKNYYFSGNHKFSIYDVVDGRAGVAVVKDRFLDKLLAMDPVVSGNIKIMSSSGELPDEILCLRSDIPPAIKAELEFALEEIGQYPSGRKALAALGYSGFTQAGPSVFAPVGKLLHEAGINIRTYKYSR
ncbi:MAG: phosphate/phosphite/phosphonate ABC transporter substrate-binding protein [Actinomycetota bacterium]|nr:phosphate/phosphite/phosphonate ABC transporter substrate-binding protein [Actinomycetota bacterium]